MSSLSPIHILIEANIARTLFNNIRDSEIVAVIVANIPRWYANKVNRINVFCAVSIPRSWEKTDLKD